MYLPSLLSILFLGFSDSDTNDTNDRCTDDIYLEAQGTAGMVQRRRRGESRAISPTRSRRCPGGRDRLYGVQACEVPRGPSRQSDRLRCVETCSATRAGVFVFGLTNTHMSLVGTAVDVCFVSSKLKIPAVYLLLCFADAGVFGHIDQV